jgi:hydrogenase assembly chaperone HypC/HupF
MCTTEPCQVVELDGAGAAVVEQRGRRRRVLLVGTDEPVDVGDSVLVHSGLVVQRLDEAEAAAQRAVWAEVEDEG